MEELDYTTIKNKTSYLLSELLRQKTYLISFTLYINGMLNTLNYKEYLKDVRIKINAYLSYVFKESEEEYEILYYMNEYLNTVDPLEFLFSDEYELFIDVLRLINNSKVKREVEYTRVCEKYSVLANTNGFKPGNYQIYMSEKRPATIPQYEKILELIPKKKQ